MIWNYQIRAECQFNEFVDPNFEHIKSLQRKNANLRRTRDLLLPKLISGEVDVSNLEIETEAHTT